MCSTDVIKALKVHSGKLFPDWDDIDAFLLKHRVTFTRERNYFDVFESNKSTLSYEDAQSLIKWGIYNI